ncbi:MAG: PAS domain S-box protein [Candidatus Marinimicrobia bacterium]|nr:PAS domain S-box protein [Candidatus Neomarinimicrobiota bacterium]
MTKFVEKTASEESEPPVYPLKKTSDQIESEADLQQQIRRLKIQNEILQSLVRFRPGKEDLPLELEMITAASAHMLNTDRCSVWLFDAKKTQITCIDLYDRNLNQHIHGDVLYSKKYPTYFHFIETEPFVDATDTYTDPRTCEFKNDYLKQLGIKSLLDIAIISNGKRIGLFSNEQIGKVREWSDDEKDFISAMAELVAITLENREIVKMLTDARENQNKFERLFDSNPEPAVFLDKNFCIINVNSRFTEVFGWTTEEVVGKQINEVVADTDMLGEAKLLDIAAEKGYLHHDTLRKRKDGSFVPVSISSAPIYIKGEIINYFAMYKDISEQKHLQDINRVVYEISQAVQATDNLPELYQHVYKTLMRLISSNNFYIGLYDPEKNEVTIPYHIDEGVNQQCISDEVYSLLAEQIINSGKSLTVTKSELRNLIQKKKISNAGLLPDAWFGIPLRVKGHIIGLFSFHHFTKADMFSEKQMDLLESAAESLAIAIQYKQHELQVRESEERYRLLVENVNDAIVISQREKFIFFNQQFATMLGYAFGELVMKDYREIYTPRGLEILHERSKRRERGEYVPSRYETIFRRKDGSIIDVEANVTIIDNQGDKATFAVIRDISDRKRIEQEREKTIQELQAALNNVRTLKGLIPICANCKKIRDDSGYWSEVEKYISVHSNVDFTHGICPDCMKKLYPNYKDKSGQK